MTLYIVYFFATKQNLKLQYKPLINNFQLIGLLHTVIHYPQLKTNKVLVICPKSTVMNWSDEIERWLEPVQGGRKLEVFHFPEAS